LSSLERDRVAKDRPIAAKEVPLVDRIEEMKLLKEAVDRTIQGEGGLVFLYGEAGIGKTRLARELRVYAHLRGMQVLYGRCPALFRMDGVTPYTLWSEVIRDYLDNSSLEQLYRVIGFYPAEVARLVPELVQKLRAIPQSFPISPEQEQNRLFEAVSQFITNISKENPLLVVLDDLQWTDPSSLLLLHYLARSVQKAPLFLLGAYRSTDIDAKHPLTQVLTELNRERLPESIQLKRMSPNDISQMIKNILEQKDFPEEFCKLVYEKTRGNPFFVEEVVKSLKEEGVIHREGNKWTFEDVSRIEFPETVKSVVKARISHLDEECQDVLTMASFVGNDFTFDALAGVTGVEESRLLDILDRLLKTGLIKHRVVRGEDLCSFADIIVRDVVYEETGAFKRKKLHGLVGRILEKVYASKIDEHFGELAAHFLESGDKDKALEYFLKAGEKAVAIYANTEAASYFQSALRLLEDGEDRLQQKGYVLERLGDIKKLAGDPKECIKYWNEALQLWVRLQEKARTATLHRKMANVLWDKIGDVEKAEEHQKACLGILKTQPKSVELARVYRDIAHMQWRMGDFPKALGWAEKALVLGENLNIPEVVADSSSELAALFSLTGEFKKSQEYANRALKIALDNKYFETAMWAYYRVANSLPPEEYEKSVEHYEKGLALAKKLGDISGQSMFLNALVGSYTLMGELDKAIALGEEAVSLNRRFGNVTRLCMTLYSLADAYLISGEQNKNEQCYDEASKFSQNLNEFQLIAASHFSLGLRHLDKEEYAKAKESFERALRVMEKAGAKGHQLWYSRFLIWTLIELGETRKAASLLDKLLGFSRESEEEWFFADEMALRSMLLRSQKKYGESIELFEKTLKEWESIKASEWNGYYFARMVLCEYARAYFERGQKGDRENALTLLDRALKMLQKMGAKKDIEKIEARIAFIETGKIISKPKSIDRISTGYADLDDLFYGGIPSNCAVVLTSPSCNERDWLITSFLETGARKGEVTFYVTINPGSIKTLVTDFQSSFYLFVCNPQADAIVGDSPSVVKLKGVENLTDISIALTSTIRKLDPMLEGPRRICIGLISDLLLQHHAVQTRRWLAGLIPGLQSEGFTTLAVIDPEMHLTQEVRAVLDLFEGEISIFEKETEEGSGKFLKIKKMCNQKYSEKELRLTRDDPRK
jgi:tetratricopeptide (TPR) repeat protein/KaiC/GvpD/RAD55 family RecA-like ATPase